jgi:hypothetical protein
LFLLFGVRDGAAASGFDGCQSGSGLPSHVDECACRGDSGAANASPAMDADTFSGPQSTGEIADESAEGLRVRREMVVGNGVGEKLHSGLLCKKVFLGQVEHHYLLFVQQRDKSFDSGPLEMLQFSVQVAAAARAEDNCQRNGSKRHRGHRWRGQRRGCICINPVDAVHSCSDSDELLDAVVDGGYGQAHGGAVFDEWDNLVEFWA